MKSIQSYINQYCLETSRTPSVAEIANAVGISKGCAQNYLKEMVNIPARNTPRIRKDGNRKSGGWKLSLRSIGNLDSGYLETCLL